MKKDQFIQALLAAMLGLLMWQAEGDRQRDTEFRENVKARFERMDTRFDNIERYWQKRVGP